MSLIKDWNPKQAVLKDALAKPERFDEAMRLCLELHGSVHSSSVSGADSPTLFDEIWQGLTRKTFETMPTAKDVTIAWNIWHITRIEDITANILIADGGVTEHKDSIWLLDFWGRKTVAGILLMPITRHQIAHINDCAKLKSKIIR